MGSYFNEAHLNIVTLMTRIQRISNQHARSF